MAEGPINRDPAPVFKSVAGFILILTTVLIVVLAIWLGREFNQWIVIAAALPSISGFVILSDKFRDLLLDIASKLPFVNYTKTP